MADTLTFSQVNDEAFNLLAGCSSETVDTGRAGGHSASLTSGTGATQYTATVTGGATGSASTRILAAWKAQAPSPDGLLWEAGDWVCRLQVSQANSSVFWDSVHICAYDGSTWTTIASNTNVNIFLIATGTKSVTLTTSSPTEWYTAGPQDIYWIYGFGKSNASEQAFKYRSNKNLVTPIVHEPTLGGQREGIVMQGIAEADSLVGSRVSRGVTQSGGVSGWSLSWSSAERAGTRTATREEDHAAASRAIRAHTTGSSVVGVNASVAMESRLALIGGGPEASFLGQG